MNENTSGSPIFADRYRFQPIDDDWDVGRSGLTSLAYDETEKRRVVIKRAETISKRLTDGLKNEEKALKTLKGLGVPGVYHTEHVNYGSKDYDYIVLEYIDGVRIEKSLASLSIVERAEIITQFFGLLSQAHQKGIVNGDVDLKHLFWRNGKEKKQLIVIDWGNARLGVDTRKKAEFAYDLARSAEIIFSLVTHKGHPPATGSLALPDHSGIQNGLEPLPNEFRALCQWAPRTPSGTPPPYTAKELFEVSKKWLDAIQNKRKFKQRLSRRVMVISSVGILAVLVVAGSLIAPRLLNVQPSATASNTSAMVISETASITSTDIPMATETVSPIDTPVATETTPPTLISIESSTVAPSATVPPGLYSPIITFDKTSKIESACWNNEANPSLKLLPLPQDGFYQRTDRNWAFVVSNEHSINEYVQVDFSQCIDEQRNNSKINALAFNVFVQRLDQLATETSREFGVFLENQNGQRREYTLLIKDGGMVFRIREGNSDPIDYPIEVINPVNIKSGGEYPRPYRSFRIMVFLEINNQGSDIIYLLEGPLEETVRVEDINPSGMFRMENAILPTLGDVQKIGLLGYGGKIEALIWPLSLMQKMTE